MAAKNIKVNPTDVQTYAQTAATAIARAAQPGPVPVAGAGSPIDTAAAGVAVAVAKNVAASSAKLAPESAAVLTRSTDAVGQMQAQEAQNTDQVAAVPQGLQGQLAQSTGTPTPSPPLPPYHDDTGQIWPTTSPPPPGPGMPRSTLDGIHGTDGNMPVLRPPGDLGPYGYKDIAPGVWVPDTDPPAPGQTVPASI